MAIELYGLKISPPSRVVMNVLRHLGLEYQLNEVNVLAGEQHDPEFLKVTSGLSALSNVCKIITQ